MTEKLKVVRMSDLKPGDEFYLIDADAWTLLRTTEYRDVVVAENMNKRIAEARLRLADARLVVVAT